MPPPTENANGTGTPQERFRTQLVKLQEMGFNDEEANIAALLAVGGSVNAAVERLLQQL